MSKSKATISVRIRKDTYEKLGKIAEANYRSIVDEIDYRLSLAVRYAKKGKSRA